MANILITGRPGVGKTSVIKKILAALQVEAGGFYTQELRAKRKRVGFELVTLGGKRGVMAHVEIGGNPRVGKYGVDFAVLEDLGVREVRRAMDECGLVVIDEIGKMELCSAGFKDAVLAALDSPKPLLATIGTGGPEFAKRVKRRPDVVIYEIDVGNRDLVWRGIVDRLSEGLNCGG